MESNNGMEKTLKKKHFVLVHGACHGAWSWYKVVVLLRAEGHRVTALDMAAAGVHPTQVEELRSFSDYCKPLMEFMATLPPDDTVVLVGHSMGGISISVAMEMFPQKISVAIFVTAFMPAPHLSVPVIIQEDLSLATLLVRPIGLYDDAEMLKETVLSTQNYGSVPRAYIISEEDKFIKEDSQKWMIQNNPTVDVKTICGSDHMVNGLWADFGRMVRDIDEEERIGESDETPIELGHSEGELNWT
ncbi:Methylesterase 2 [Forsythia ovata]|uniref:Methylesterase 2 n=1 Tax=Forsythia ovata TaxID=205694 RepID=A0ABD1WQR6_9LAMI